MIWNSKKQILDISSVDLDILQSAGKGGTLFSVDSKNHYAIPPIPCIHWLILMVKENIESVKAFWAEYRKITTLADDPSVCYSTREIDGRIVHSADFDLRRYQKWVLDNILSTAVVSPYATAYVKGSSTRDNAEPHVGHSFVIKMDVRHFFDSITYRQVYRAFEKATGYPASVLVFLSKLCCLNGHLPQGACTSPMLSNLCMSGIDKELGSYCNEKGITYTRYCDDITFSADKIEIPDLIDFVSALLERNGFRINKRKTHILHKGVSHNVTGIVCNEKMSIPSEYKRKIRQEMYYIDKYGLDEHLRHTNQEKYSGNYQAIQYLNSLIGRISYVLSVEGDNERMYQYRLTASGLLMDCLKKAGYSKWVEKDGICYRGYPL